MTSLLLSQIADWIRHAAQRIWNSLRPRSCGSEIVGMAVDVSRSRRELVIENAVLRHYPGSRIIPHPSPSLASLARPQLDRPLADAE